MNAKTILASHFRAHVPARGRAWLARLVALAGLGLLAAGGARAGVLGPRLRALERAGLSAAVPAGSARAVRDPLAPRVDASGRVQVVIHPAVPGVLPDTGEIAALGGSRIRVSPLLDEIQAWVPAGELSALAALPGVGRVGVPTYAVVEPPPFGVREPVAIPRSSTLPKGLPIDQVAVQAMQAALLQDVGADGQGIKVGVISVDDSGNAASQAAGYLPASIFQDPNFPGTTPTPGDPAEGTAMLEEVHAMAPQAQLGFCGNGDQLTEMDLLTCYRDFVTWGANVVVDDYYLFEVDFFTRGLHTSSESSFASAVAAITSANPNVAFLSAAGNDAQDYFQATYAPTSSSCTIGGTTYTSCMDFGTALGNGVGDELPVAFLAPSTSSQTSTFHPFLEWNDPLVPGAGGESIYPDQFQLFLVNGSGSVLAQGQFGVTNDGRPFESFAYTLPDSSNFITGDSLVVACLKCPDHVTLKLMGYGDGAVLYGTLTQSGGSYDYTPMYKPGSIDAGQKVAPGVEATVATAVDALSPLSTTLESYSALGPFLYGNYGSTGTQADPSITGVDDVETSGAGGFSAANPLPNGGVTFCGTSATSPNVGALVADLMSADPTQPASFYENALEQTASTSAIGTSPIPSNNPTGLACSPGNTQGYTADDAGAGLAQGYAALASFFTFPTTTVTAPPSVSVSSGQTVKEDVPLNVAITYQATVTAGTNPATTTGCEWMEAPAGSTSGTAVTGPSATYTFASAGAYTVTANCPDSQGILNPQEATVEVTVENIPPPSPSSSGGGGGVFGPLGLLLCAALAGLRARRRRV